MTRSEIPIRLITSPSWNPNEMDPVMRSMLKESHRRYGNLGVLVVRNIARDQYETIGGAQRLALFRELGIESAPCVIVQANDAEARLMAQALNNISGTDDFGRKAEALKLVLESVPREQVMSLLPETAGSLDALSALTPSSLAGYLGSWEEKRGLRLKHGTFQFTPDQLSDVETAIEIALTESSIDEGNPNRRGTALHHICKSFIEQRAL